MIYTKVISRKQTNQMKKLSKQRLDEFFMQLDELSVTSAPREILSIILGWMKSNAEIFDQKPFSDYYLADILKLNIDIYPVDHSSLHGVSFINFRNLLKECKHGYKHQGRLAALLSGALESLLFLEVDIQCPNCKSGGFLVWKNEFDSRLIYECRQCGFVNCLNEDAEYHLVPATTSELIQASLI